MIHRKYAPTYSIWFSMKCADHPHRLEDPMPLPVNGPGKRGLVQARLATELAD